MLSYRNSVLAGSPITAARWPTIRSARESELTCRAGECYQFVCEFWWGFAGGVLASLFPLSRLSLTNSFEVPMKLTGGWG